MMSLYKKEISTYLKNPVGYIVIALFGFFANFFFVKDIFILGSASMRPFFEIVPWLFMIFIPAITMRSIAEEKRSNTIETLLTLPVSETQIVISKFLALISIIGIGLVLTLGLPVSLLFISNIYLPEVIVGYVGVLLLACLYVSISLFFSSITGNQIVALLASALVLFFLQVLATDIVAASLPKFVNDVVGYLSPVLQIQNFFKGVIDLRSTTYFVSFAALFIVLTIIDLEKRS